MSYYGGGGGDNRYSDRSSHRDSGGYGGSGGGSYGGGRYGGGQGSSGGSFSNGGLGANLKTIAWDSTSLTTFEKNFYIEHPAVTSRSVAAAEDWRKTHSITVVGHGIPKPCLTFEEASMPGK